MAVNIKLDPALLNAQSQEMYALAAEYDTLFKNVTATLKNMDESWSDVLSANFTGKILTAQKSFSDVTELLSQGAIAAITASITMEDVDKTLAGILGGGTNPGGSNPGGGVSNPTGGDGAFGGGGSGGGRGGSLWQQVKVNLADSWDKAGNVMKYLEEQYNKLPKGIKKGADKIISGVLGGSGKAALQITTDILNGDLGWDTLETALGAIGTETPVISAVVNTGKTVLENGTMQLLRESSRNHAYQAGVALREGDIGGCISNLTTSLAEDVAQFGYGLGEVATEVVADIWTGTVGRISDKVTGVADIVGEGLSKIGCETIGNAVSAAADAVSGAVNAVGGFLRNLIK